MNERVDNFIRNITFIHLIIFLRKAYTTIDGTDISVVIPYFTKAFIIPAMKEALMLIG